MNSWGPSWAIETVTPPATEPVTLVEARSWARIDDNDTTQDWALVILIGEARRYAENLTGQAFIRRTLEFRLQRFPSHVIEIPRPPLVSVSSVSYLDAAETWQVLGGSPDEFQVDTTSKPGRIMPLSLQTWPTIASGSFFHPVRIRYVCGHGAIKDVPPELRLWMQMRVSTFHEQREQIRATNSVALERGWADGILDPLVLGSRIA